MAIALRGTPTTAHTTAGGTLTVTVPTGIVTGDVLLINVTVGAGTAVPATPTGLTQLDTQTAGPSVASYYRVCDGTETSYAFTVSAISGATARAYSGVDNTTPINAHGAFNNSLTATTTVTANSITTTLDGCMLIFLMGAGGVAASFTPPAGFTNGAFNNFAGSVNAGSYDESQATAGATGSQSGTLASSLKNDGGLIALAPVGASAPTNTVAPVVSGTTVQGQTLTTTNGTWTDAGGSTFTYQWQRDNSGGGTYSNISSGTSSTYVLTATDVGCNVRCVVTDTDSTTLSGSANSNAVGPITDPSLSTVVGKTGTSGTAVMQKAKSGWTYITGKTGTSGTAVDQKGAGSYTKIKGH